jgi:hypothetical protein
MSKDQAAIHPALQRACRKIEEGVVGFVQVKSDYRAAPRRSLPLEPDPRFYWPSGRNARIGIDGCQR